VDSAFRRFTASGTSGELRKTLLAASCVAVVYYLFAKIGIFFLVHPDGFAAFWPAAGLLPPVLLFLRKNDRVPTVAAVFASISIVNMTAGMSPAASVAYAAVHCVESVAAAWTLGRITGGKVAILGTGDFFRFLLFCVVVICGGSAIFGAAASVFLGGNPSFLAAFFLWWAANATGMLLITPLLLSLAPVVSREEMIRKDRVVEMIAIAVVLCVSTVIVFVRSPSEPLTALSMFRRPWALLVPMMWAALRLQPRCIAFFSLLLWSIAIFFTSRGYGPYRIPGIPIEASFTTLFAFLTVAYISSYVTASLLRETAEGGKREEKIRALLEETQSISRIGGWEYDVSNGRITWTPEVYRIYGVDRDYDPNDVDRDIARYAPGSAPVIERAFRNALEKGEPYDLELELIRGTGERNQVRTIRTIGKATLVNGKVVRVFGNIADITEQKRAGEERRKLERELEIAKKRESLGTMAGGIAHQFNNLLTGVLGYIELARDSLPPASAASNHLREAEGSALRASELSRAMLVYLGQGVRQRKRLDVDRLVQEHLPVIRTELPGNVRLEIDVPSGGPAVFMDPADFRQVLSTLCTNAWEAIGESEGVVRISVSAVRDAAEIPGSRYATGSVSSGPWACLKVADTGAGMDRETMDRIFDPFFSTKFPGRGLGLPVVQGIVRHYGGAIHVQSHPGQGTMVSVLFPETGPVSPA
jgi:signal transduction histidine kinase